MGENDGEGERKEAAEHEITTQKVSEHQTIKRRKTGRRTDGEETHKRESAGFCTKKTQKNEKEEDKRRK
jgi:hypothetical protein